MEINYDKNLCLQIKKINKNNYQIKKIEIFNK